MSILEKSKKHIQAYLAKLEKASAPSPDLTRHRATCFVYETCLKLLEDPYRQDIDEDKCKSATLVFMKEKFKDVDWNSVPLDDNTFGGSDYREYIISYIDKSDKTQVEKSKEEFILQIENQQLATFVDSIGEPITRMLPIYYKNKNRFRKDIRTLNEHINACPDPEEIYETLLAYENDEAVSFIIDSTYSSSEQTELITAFQSHDKNVFCSLLSKNPMGLRSFSGLCFLHEYLQEILDIPGKSTEEFQHGLDTLDLFTKEMEEAISDDGQILDESKLADDLVNIVKEELLSPSKSPNDLSSSMKLFLSKAEKMMSGLVRIINKAIEKMTPAERVIFERVLNRPEGQPYIQYLKRKFAEEEQAEAQEQPREGQNIPQRETADAPSEDTSKQGAQHKEPLTGTSGAGKDGTPYKKFIVPNNFKGQSPHWDKDEYFFAMNEKIGQLGAKGWNDILDKLVSFRFLAEDKDKQLLFYRLTGLLRPEGELGFIKWNSEDGHCKELLFFLKYILPGNASKKYDKVKGYFCELSKWPEKKPSTYAQGANKYFKIAMHAAAPEVFPEYNKRERKPKKSIQKLDS